jgi:hypothetical protein
MSTAKNALVGAGLAGMCLISLPAAASHIPGLGFFEGQDFTFDATAFGGGQITAEAIDFSYQAEADQFDGSFDETGVAFFGTFRDPLGGPPVPGSGLGSAYNMYATFTGAGTVAGNPGGGVDGTFTQFDVQLFIDAAMDTTTNNLGAGDVGDPDQSKSVSNTADDVQILTGTLDGRLGGFHVFSGQTAGDFDVEFLVTSFDPSVFGGAAFANPGVVGNINGVNSNVLGVVPVGTAQTDIIINGSGNAAFRSEVPPAVPEPGTLLLLGTGLLAGLGFARRHSSKG